jgi:hypothetical protein
MPRCFGSCPSLAQSLPLILVQKQQANPQIIAYKASKPTTPLAHLNESHTHFVLVETGVKDKIPFGGETFLRVQLEQV